MVVLFCGGDKSSQEADIARVHNYWKEFQHAADQRLVVDCGQSLVSYTSARGTAWDSCRRNGGCRPVRFRPGTR